MTNEMAMAISGEMTRLQAVEAAHIILTAVSLGPVDPLDLALRVLGHERTRLQSNYDRADAAVPNKVESGTDREGGGE